MPIKQAAPRQHHFMQITSQQIEEIRAGKIKTFEILFNAYYPRVKSFAFGMIKESIRSRGNSTKCILKVVVQSGKTLVRQHFEQLHIHHRTK